MRVVAALMVLAAVIAAALLWPPLHVHEAAHVDAAQTPVATAPPSSAPGATSGAVWAISFVRARPGQRQRLERFLQLNWLALDEQALQQQHIKSYRMLRADPDPREASWDFAVIIEYADRQAMSDFVPFYVKLASERPHQRVDGLDFADLGSVVQQKVVEPVNGAIETPGE